jgi:hypothetical protein
MLLVVLALCLAAALGMVGIAGLVDEEQRARLARPLIAAAVFGVVVVLRWMFGDTYGARDPAHPLQVRWLLRVGPSVALYTLGGILVLVAPFARQDVKVATGVVGVGLLVVAEVLRRALRPGHPLGRAAVIASVAVAVIGLLWFANIEPSAIDDPVRLFDQTTADGVHLGVEVGDVGYQAHRADGSSGWTRSRGLLISFDLPDGRSAEVTVPAATGFEGDAERLIPVALKGSDAVTFTAIQVADDVTAVRMQLVDGAYEEIAPVGGFAVFATVTGRYGWAVEVIDATGNVTVLR